MVREITVRDFEKEVLQSELPVFVDFWAEWCRPCKMVSPIIEELAGEYKDKMKFVKINVNDFPEIATRYGIMSIPTMLVFKEGKIVAQTVGGQTKKQLKNFLDDSLKNNERSKIL